MFEVRATSFFAVPSLSSQRKELHYHRPGLTRQTRHASTHYRLRLHRARSVILSPAELVEIRAAQRTFEGAYIRTSLSQFSFALVVLKIFTSEFYSIGEIYMPPRLCYPACIGGTC